MSMFDLSGKVAIVTGGNRGIGFAIAPGTIITEFNRKHFEDHPEELAEIIKSIPMGRTSDPVDCVSAALFFASDASDFVTGHVLFTDGGTTIC